MHPRMEVLQTPALLLGYGTIDIKLITGKRVAHTQYRGIENPSRKYTQTFVLQCITKYRSCITMYYKLKICVTMYYNFLTYFSSSTASIKVDCIRISFTCASTSSDTETGVVEVMV